jgi:hypothetical protein
VERAFATLFGKTRSMLNAARITIPLRKVLWAHCAEPFVQLENIIVKEKHQQPSSEKAYGKNPKWISNMRTFGEMAIVARQSDKKIRNKLADRGNTVMFFRYSEFHEKDVYKFWHLATNKALISRDAIWLNKIYSDHMDITKVNYMTTEVEEAECGEEEEPNEDQEEPFDLPSVEEAHSELLIDTTVTDKPSIIPVPYPKSTRELRSLSYGTIGPAPKNYPEN